MKQKNYFIEILIDAEGNKTFILRQPNGQSVTPIMVSSDAADIMEFLNQD